MDSSTPTAPTEAKQAPWWVRSTEALWQQVFGPLFKGFESFGHMLVLLGQAIYWLFRRPFRWREHLVALDFIGVGSLSIIILVGVFTGAAFSLQVTGTFRMFGMESYIGAMVTLALVRELAPVLTALMVTARAGSAMATELGSMRITEQIDALRTMAVSPVQYLVTPRILASVIMMPLLTMVFSFAGMVGAYFVAVILLEVDHGLFVAETEWMVDTYDIKIGLIKAAIFGVVLSTIGCQQGFFAKGGAKGVGLATTQAVVYSCVTILMLDYFVGDILLIIYESPT